MSASWALTDYTTGPRPGILLSYRVDARRRHGPSPIIPPSKGQEFCAVIGWVLIGVTVNRRTDYTTKPRSGILESYMIDARRRHDPSPIIPPSQGQELCTVIGWVPVEITVPCRTCYTTKLRSRIQHSYRMLVRRRHGSPPQRLYNKAEARNSVQL